MVFDSLEFVVFFAIVYAVYLMLRRYQAQNVWLLGASYFFYGFWSWKFLGLLLATQTIDYHISQALGRLTDPVRRRRLMWLSVMVNMGTLGFFKYFNFFTENLQHTLRFFGAEVSEVTLNIVLPVGISFYTIQEMTYIIDIYRGRTKPVKKFTDFALFVAFFPQLLAGPIERAERLMPQVQSQRVITRTHIVEGSWLFCWGLFKKMFVADRIAMVSDSLFSDPGGASAPLAVLGALAFTIQIYADFSGYSDMSAGLGRLMGFRLMYNFHLPFFAVTPSDFWRRWHISLSQCLRDNLYIPLGGNRFGYRREMVALMVTMLIGGLWHGAQWHFVMWGAYCGGLLVLERAVRLAFGPDALLRPINEAPLSRRVAHIAVMFPLTVIGFVIFRAETTADAGLVFVRMFGDFGDWDAARHLLKEVFFCSAVLFGYQWAHYLTNDRYFVFRLPWPVRAVFYFALYLFLVSGAPHDARTFIYFQF